MLELIGQTVGRYEVHSLEGEGGMGEVYLAWDTRLNRKVALKRLSPALHHDENHRRRFLQEAERAASLSHQNIASMHDVVEHDGEVFLIMEFVEGRSFEEYIDNRLRIPEFLDLAIQITEALEAAHEHNIVHRDVKPSNIRVTDTGQVKILDFGVARRIPTSLDDSRTATEDTTSKGSVVGTPSYMAPEILIGRGADPRSDLFSLGIVFYQALTGRHPFLCDTFAMTAGRIMNEAPTPAGELNSRIPRELEHMLDKLLAKDPDQRYATASDVLADLRRVRNQFTPVSKQPAGRRRGSWKHWLGYAAAAAVFLAIVLLVVPTTREPITDWINPAPLPVLKHVGVLPFEAANADDDHAALVLGLSARLTSDLARLTAGHADLLVARPSQIESLGVSSVQEGEEELGTTLVLRGNLDDHDRTHRLQIVLDGPDRLRRAATLEAPSDDPFVLYERLVEAVVGMLEVDWTESERRALRQDFESHDPAACAFLLRGRGYLRDKENEASLRNAITQFDSALVVEPGCATAMAGLGLAQWRLGELVGGEDHPEQAIQNCQAALETDKTLVAGNECLAKIYARVDRLEEAAEQLEIAHRNNPTDDEVLRDIQSALANLGKFSEVESLLKNAIARRPNDWRPHYDLAYLQAVDLGRHADAATELEEATRLAPRLYRAHSFLGAEYAELMRYEDAVRALETSLAIRETNVNAHNNLATSYFYQRNWPGAAAHYARAIELGYDDPTMWGNLGDARYWSPGDREEAADAYERALQLAEQSEERPDGDILGKMAVWSAMLGRSEEAMALSTEAVEMAPRSPAVLMKAARVCDQLGDPAGAVDWIEKALTAGYEIEHLLADPIFDNLRRNPEFERIRSVQ